MHIGGFNECSWKLQYGPFGRSDVQGYMMMKIGARKKSEK